VQLEGLSTQIGIDLSGFNAGFKSALGTVSSFSNDVSKSVGSVGVSIDRMEKGATSGLGKFTSGISSAAKSTTSFFGGMAATAGGFLAANVIGGIAGQVGGLASGMVMGNSAMEGYGVQFETLIKNSDDFKTKYAGVTDSVELQGLAAKEAQIRMGELADFGANTPFELPGVIEADRIIQGFGLHSQQAAKDFGFSGAEIRTIAGDVASGTGVDFSEMALNIGKFSKGAVGESLSRFQELGVVTRDELASMGLEFSKSGELLSPLPEATNVLLTAMREKFGGLMQSQSATFGGMLSNAQDWAAGTLRTLGQPTFEILKDKLGVALEFMNRPETGATIQRVADMLGVGMGRAIDIGSAAFSKISGVLTDKIIPAFNVGKQVISS